MADDVKFHVDLVQQTIHHLTFLKTACELKVLHEPSVLQSAIRRYEEMWLPLAADHPNECLSAPLDIEWAWHCHMLAPQNYAQTCEARFNVLINHTIRSGDEYEKALLISEQYWRQKYPDDKDGFRFDKLGQAPIFKESRPTSLYSSLASAMERQISFYYQVSLPHFRDKQFLMSAHDRYRKFLYLKSTLPADSPVVPYFDIDLIWHTHQLNPVGYDKDTRGLLGYVLDHNDDVEGLRKSGQLQNETFATTVHWQLLFREVFTRDGINYRGMIPDTHFEKQYYNFTLMGIKVTDVFFDAVNISLPDIASDVDYDALRVCIWRNPDEKFFGKVTPTTMPDLSRSVSCQHDSDNPQVVFDNPQVAFDNPQVAFDNPQVVFDKPLHFVPANNNDTLDLHIELIQMGQPVRFKNNSNKAKSKAVIRIALTDRVNHLADRQTFRNCGQLGPHMSIEMHETVTTSLSAMSRLVFRLEEGPVQQEYVDWRDDVLGPGRTNKEQCLVALHSYDAGENRWPYLYHARVLHVLSPGAFLVQIVQQDDLRANICEETMHVIAAVHLIGPGQLPRPDQVETADRCITLDPARQERALLIKSRTGDWGIVTGRSTRSRDKEQGSGETESFEIDFWKLPSGQRTPCHISKDRLYAQTPWFSVDLVLGIVTMDASNVLEMGETLAFAFAVSLMTMMCTDVRQGPTVSDSDPPPTDNPITGDCTDEQLHCTRAEELPHAPEWTLRKFFRACALGQLSLFNRCSSSGLYLHYTGTSVVLGIHSYEYLSSIFHSIEQQRRNKIARRKEEMERIERERILEKEEDFWRHTKHTAGMCLGCGPSGCRGHR